MKKLLVLGACVRQLELIKCAKKLGYYVGVVDYDPEAIGISCADEYFNESTMDSEAVLKVAKIFKPDGIVTAQTDMPMRCIAKANEVLNLNGINSDTAMKATDKVAMIECFERNNVACPWYFTIKSEAGLEKIINKISYPCIFKPADNSGSRGVFFVEDQTMVAVAYEYSKTNSNNGKVLIEEYLAGPEVSVEIIVQHGDIQVIAVTDKLTTGAPYFVEMGHSQPSQLPEESVIAIKNLATEAIKAVGIQDGEGHVEIILTQNGPKIVELGARLGGDFITSDLVPLSTGVDMHEATIRIACGEKADVKVKINRGSAIRYFNSEIGVLQSVTGIEEAYKIPGVKKIEVLMSPGDSVGVIKNSLERVGCIISEGKDAQEAIECCEKALKLIRVNVI